MKIAGPFSEGFHTVKVRALAICRSRQLKFCFGILTLLTLSIQKEPFFALGTQISYAEHSSLQIINGFLCQQQRERESASATHTRRRPREEKEKGRKGFPIFIILSLLFY